MNLCVLSMFKTFFFKIIHVCFSLLSMAIRTLDRIQENAVSLLFSKGFLLRIGIMPSCSGTTKLLCRQWKIEDGARSHGLGEKGGKGLPFFNESLHSHWANHRGDPFLGTMPPTNVIQKDSQKMINDYVDRLENTHTHSSFAYLTWSWWIVHGKKNADNSEVATRPGASFS